MIILNYIILATRLGFGAIKFILHLSILKYLNRTIVTRLVASRKTLRNEEEDGVITFK